MKMLVATGEPRSPDGEFNWCDENEPVDLPLGVCDNAETCRCAHSWVGMRTTRGTTRAVVAEVPMTITAYKELIRDLLVQQGYIPKGTGIHSTNVRRTYFDLVNIVEKHEVGTVLKFTSTGPVVAEPSKEA